MDTELLMHVMEMNERIEQVGQEVNSLKAIAVEVSVCDCDIIQTKSHYFTKSHYLSLIDPPTLTKPPLTPHTAPYTGGTGESRFPEAAHSRLPKPRLQQSPVHRPPYELY